MLYCILGIGLLEEFAVPVVHIVFASVWGYHLALAHLIGESVIRTAALWLGITAIWLWRLKIIVALNTLDADQRA